jgi:K(+)-stimulated pyrophosphate-energized sodium pump
MSLEMWAVLAAAAAVVGLAYAGLVASRVLKHDPGTERMREIMELIQAGAMAFLRREYSVLIWFVPAVAIVIAVVGAIWDVGLGWQTSIAYLVGSFFSAGAGFIGMLIATRANARTANAARESLAKALDVAFKGGSVMGMVVGGLGLLGVTVIWLVFREPQYVNGFALGASSIALFARVGGGIYTKAADVGADLVGKVEAGIPEDDPRNPGVIADNVGDNVGDVAGMGADLFESFVGSIIATMALGVVLVNAGANDMLIVLPMIIAGGGILASIIGTFFVRAREGVRLHTALNLGTYVATGLTIAVMFLAIVLLLPEENQGWTSYLGFFWGTAAGLLAGVAIGKVTEYYTSDHYQPVKTIASASQTGTATNIIRGIGVGMESVVVPVILVVSAIAVAFYMGQRVPIENSGVYGIALAALGMLSTTAMTISVDAYGPIADNAGGIAEMSELPPEVRQRTDQLDSLGNTTAAIAKGFAIGSAALTALALFTAFSQTFAEFGGGTLTLDLLAGPAVVIGLFLGGALPFLFSALTMNAVGRAAGSIIDEVRRQFREIPGLMEGKARPDSATCVSIVTGSALKEMIIPGLLAVVVPLVVGLISPVALGGLLAGALVSGFLLAIMMANAGGAWDNAKKYIESGQYGGKGSPPHAAAVVGDTVGDPFKDTSGPSMNILIKLMSVVALVFAPVFAAIHGG